MLRTKELHNPHFLKTMLAFSESSFTVSACIIWQFSEVSSAPLSLMQMQSVSVLSVCGATCLCRAECKYLRNQALQVTRPHHAWWLAGPVRKGGTATNWERKATCSCLGNAAVNVVRDTMKDQSCARNDYESASNKRQQLWSPWII